MENNIDKSNGNWNNINSTGYNHNSITFGIILRPLCTSINNTEILKCKSMTLDFENIPQNVSKIYFKNYYTYTVSVLIMRISITNPNRLKKWYIAIRQKVMLTDLIVFFYAYIYIYAYNLLSVT